MLKTALTTSERYLARLRRVARAKDLGPPEEAVCPGCLRRMTFAPGERVGKKKAPCRITLDHIQRRALRTYLPSDPENLRFMCFACNSSLPSLGDCVAALSLHIQLCPIRHYADNRWGWRQKWAGSPLLALPRTAASGSCPAP